MTSVAEPRVPFNVDLNVVIRLLADPPCAHCQSQKRAHEQFGRSIIACTSYEPMTTFQLHDWIISIDTMLSRYHASVDHA